MFFTAVAVAGILMTTACSTPVTPIVAEVSPQMPTPFATETPKTYPDATMAQARPTSEPTPIPTNETPATSTVARSTETIAIVSSDTPTVPTVTPTTDTRLPPDRWQEWPVVPIISARAVQIYQDGVKAGRNPHAFSKIGDCESVTEWFLADFDKGPKYYDLGPYSDLQPVIDAYQGSFKRLGQAAKPGFTAASLLTPLWANPEKCNKNESPLDCEIRNNNPSLVLITLGTNDAVRPETFDTNMRRVLDRLVQQNILPVLATKADNVEKDNSINATIARLAYEYDLPLWNFWSAVQGLPDSGLQEDGAHLTWSPNDFRDPENLKRAWPVRNLSALQVLDAIRLATNGQ